MRHRYFIINKPYGVLSQFTPEHGNVCLKDIFDVPTDVYPVGRLDKDSEGLLLLTSDKYLNNKALNPNNKAPKIYQAQLDGAINEQAIQALQEGVAIKVNKKVYTTLPCGIKQIGEPNLWERTPPIRVRKNIPTSWIEIELHEGKNRQIRKMTAAVEFPTLRIVRTRIGDLRIDKLLPGELLELEQEDIYAKLNVK